jgi:hypothetical protein
MLTGNDRESLAIGKECALVRTRIKTELNWIVRGGEVPESDMPPGPGSQGVAVG